MESISGQRAGEKEKKIRRKREEEEKKLERRTSTAELIAHTLGFRPMITGDITPKLEATHMTMTLCGCGILATPQVSYRHAGVSSEGGTNAHTSRVLGVKWECAHT